MNGIDRLLLVGLGSIGNRHLNNIKKLIPDTELIVLRSRKSADAVDGCEVVSSVESALKFKPRVAVICSPSSFHLEVAVRLAEAGVHLFIEKPLSNNVEGIEKFADIVLRKNIKVMVGYNLRFAPSLVKLRALLLSGDYGRAQCVSAEVGQYLPDWRPDVDYRATVSARADFGGGVLLELSHELDYLSWLLGEAVYVSGQVCKVSNLEIDVEDLVLAHIGFENDGRRLPCSIHMDFLQRRPYRSCKIICEYATLQWDAIEDCVTVSTKEEIKIEFQGNQDRNYTYETELLQFFECIESNTHVPIPIDDGLRVLRLIEALRVSSESGKIIYLK